MIITTKKHNRIIRELKEQYAEKHKQLTEELKVARDFKTIIDNIYSNNFINGSGFAYSAICSSYKFELPEDVLQYTDDILGGKVIKQEGNKCIVITKEGGVKQGLTKQKVDKGYSYKLVRQ